MKDLKCLVLLMILLGFTISSSAQSFISEVEIFGGTSHSYLRWDFPYRQNLNLSFVGGIGVTHIVRERIEIDAKIMVEEKGFQTDYVETLFDANNNAITSRYIQSGQLRYTTLVLMPRILLDNRNHFFTGIGSYFSLLNRASETSGKVFNRWVSVLIQSYRNH
ncbi:MAG TPA: hypothetical protein PK185_04665 [Cyclobacteriaceae bacterium]|nr:hypothetical protein [Cyclobacteriaceae bacterium]HRK53184.1 hypothetical protein [Cyclobacteriaceae bacterium]